MLLSIQVVVSLMNGLFDPATKGMLPQLINENELSRANSAIASLKILAGLVGPVIGTLLYASLSITVVFLINGISFLLSSCSEIFIQYKYVKRESVTGTTGFITDLSEGIRFILDNKVICKLCFNPANLYCSLAFVF
ncbi:MAG: MFS transporter [Thermotaleaceae bacterium]